MAFITLQRASDDPGQALLVNTAHIVSVELAPYAGPGKYSHQIDVQTVRQGAISGYFATLEKARAAYDNLAGNIAPDAATIIFY